MAEPFENMYDDKYARLRVRRAVDLLKPYISENDIVVDIGCFTQEVSKILGKKVKYIGVDFKGYNDSTLVHNLNSGMLPIPCDAFLCLETLEHLLSPAKILVTAFECMSARGYCVISLPNEATIFHRIRAVFGTVDAECFSDRGKHLHLPSLKQCREFLGRYGEIVREEYYINPSAKGSRQEWLGLILRALPDFVHQTLANLLPALFARGFIFLLRKRPM